MEYQLEKRSKLFSAALCHPINLPKPLPNTHFVAVNTTASITTTLTKLNYGRDNNQ